MTFRTYMTTAKKVAGELASLFRATGKLAGAVGQKGSAGATPAASADGEERFATEALFTNLTVQSVAYEKGADEERVRLYATNGTAAQYRKLPKTVGDVEVVVSKMGRVSVRQEAQTALGPTEGTLYMRGKRIACGSSCAPTSEQYAGTLGALVRRKTDGELYILSNNHVLAACNHTSPGMPILSPSTIDGAPNRPAPQHISDHADIVELRSGAPEFVKPNREDVAIARVVKETLLSSWQGDGSNGYDTPAKIADPSSGMRVKKFGRTTGLTLGTVEALSAAPQAIPYTGKHFKATVWLDEVWTVRADEGYFALGGDSGSLVVSEDGANAIGLLFAQSHNGAYGLMFAMTHIAKQFGGLALVFGHGV